MEKKAKTQEDAQDTEGVEIKSYTLMKKEGLWFPVVLTSKGRKITNVEVLEGNTRECATNKLTNRMYMEVVRGRKY